MNQQRLDCERLIYKVMAILDETDKHHGESPNVEFWTRIFAKLNDKQFEEMILKPFSIYYQTSGLKKECSMTAINKGLDAINVPLLEEVYMPYKYKDRNGRPVKSKKCLVLYLHMKRMKQLLSKKNHATFNTAQRDLRTGLLTGHSKGGRESDREFESLAISGLTKTIKELSRSRADSMEDKNQLNAQIRLMGTAKLSDLPNDPTDSLSKNLLNVYFLGAGLKTNLVTPMYETPLTAKQKKMKAEYA